MYYILTTHFPDHWDKIRNNKTSYLKKFLNVPKDELIDNTQAIFLRINRSNGNIEKSWLVKVHNIEITRDKLNFSVSIEKENEVDPEFTKTKIGWYVIDEELHLTKEPPNVTSNNFNIQELSGNWDKGWALDLHTLHSIKLADGKFDTTYTFLGNALNKLKYWKDRSFIPAIIDAATEFINSEEYKEYFTSIDVIIPGPPSDTSRSFQPVYELAKLLSSRIGKPIDTEYLIKLKSTSQLKGIEDPDKRKEILKNAFDLQNNNYENKNILLFDDLFRSGSTLEEITNVLKHKGKVNKIFILTITKTRTKR
jgi:competence protein ComFC